MQFSLDSALSRADIHHMTISAAPLVAMVVAASTCLLTSCAHDPSAEIDSATNAAVATSLRSLPSVTGSTVTEQTAGTDTVLLRLTTALDQATPEDALEASVLARQGAVMVYATRHDTIDAVAVTVYGVNSAAGGRPAHRPPLAAHLSGLDARRVRLATRARE